MPKGKGNPEADLASAIAQKCDLSGVTIKYIWGFADKQTTQREIFIPLWYNMQ